MRLSCRLHGSWITLRFATDRVRWCVCTCFLSYRFDVSFIDYCASANVSSLSADLVSRCGCINSFYSTTPLDPQHNAPICHTCLVTYQDYLPIYSRRVQVNASSPICAWGSQKYDGMCTPAAVGARRFCCCCCCCSCWFLCRFDCGTACFSAFCGCFFVYFLFVSSIFVLLLQQQSCVRGMALIPCPAGLIRDACIAQTHIHVTQVCFVVVSSLVNESFAFGCCSCCCCCSRVTCSFFSRLFTLRTGALFLIMFVY